ncbi:MAG: 50S ribosomal protein L4 [Thaumarchaeota archaeon]|jgi:large subunit ribosomal protein L4e|nr:50S ribosomal protein L4 [Nitrososphaerota archaeon]
MKTNVYDAEGKPIKEIELPKLFESSVNKILIERAFWIMFTHKLQPKGRDPTAGMKVSAESWGTGYGIARLARIKGSGTPRAGQAGGVASVVKGRLAHPPKAEKKIYKRINKKERLAATESALAATINIQLVKERGHRYDGNLPIVVYDDVEKINKTKNVEALLIKLGLSNELERIKEKGVGPLFVVSGISPLIKAARNIKGVDAVTAKDVSVLHLAPGGKPGRLVIYTESALNVLNERFKEVGVYGR